MTIDRPKKVFKKGLIILLIVSFFDLLTLTLLMLISWVLRLIPLSEINLLGHLNIPIYMSLLFSTISGIAITIWTHEIVLKKLLYGITATLIIIIPLFILNAIAGGSIALILFSL